MSDNGWGWVNGIGRGNGDPKPVEVIDYRDAYEAAMSRLEDVEVALDGGRTYEEAVNDAYKALRGSVAIALPFRGQV